MKYVPITMLAVSVFAVASTPAGGEDAEGVAFFEKHVRPLLVEHCYECHSAIATAVKGDLLLDTRAAMRQGGESGPAIAPGHAEQSLLIEAIRWESLEMPPSGKLPDRAIELIAEWIEIGAPDPREGNRFTSKQMTIEEGREFWSFKRPSKPQPPEVRQTRWPRTDIDRFILARLEEHDLAPSPATDKQTLLRRTWSDLVGLPLSYADAREFEADDSEDAFERVVDGLLQSEHFGERWGRYWLDLARYADTGAQNRRFAYSFSYRDWVIRALNKDIPYDSFVRAQLAADLLPAAEHGRDLAALGFLALGTNLPRPTDVPENIDDRIDVTTRSLLGLTVACARCHDHKFDSIPTHDYYALYSVFLNTSMPLELVETARSTAAPARSSHSEFYFARLETRRAALDAFRRKRLEAHKAETREQGQLQRYLLASWEGRDASSPELQQLCRKRDLNLYLLRRWRRHLVEAIERRDPIFLSWNDLADIAPDLPRARAREIWSGRSFQLPSLLKTAIVSQAPTTPAELAACLAKALASASRPNDYRDPGIESLRQVLWGEDAPTNVPFRDFWWVQNEGDSNVLKSLKWGYDSLFADYAFRAAPPYAMVVRETDRLQPSFVFRRGNQHDHGDPVPARFLSVLSDPGNHFSDGSGRRELAEAIANRTNPLTARVMVNRVWQHLFGEGIVRTPSDFGTRGAPPTHPQLLDYLAVTFMEDGWSLKRLIRRIMLSRVYQQSSATHHEYSMLDPDNRWLSRANRRRLDFEALRDSMLAVTGRLEGQIGGAPFDLGSVPATPRRSIYAYIERERIAGLLKSFDFSDPEQHTPQRHSTTVPQQALFMMNSPFVAEQSRFVASRALGGSSRTVANDTVATREGIRRLHELIFARDATDRELALGERFLEGTRAQQTVHDAAPSAWEYGFGGIDASAQRIVGFVPFRCFTGAAWQESSILPAVRSGRAHLTRVGGAPGDDLRHAVVRRWNSPIEGRVAIRGRLRQQLNPIDRRFEHINGVRGWVISSHQGILGQWKLLDEEVEMNLEPIVVRLAETIDFVVDALDDYEKDGFSWAPVIELQDASLAKNVGRHRWDAEKDFRGPDTKPLDIWEQYAQVLLMTNEFAYVD